MSAYLASRERLRAYSTSRVGLTAFRRRRVLGRQTLGEKLRRARVRKKVTLSQAEEATKVRARYLAALEAGRYEELPGSVYILGYLRRYAQFLALKPSPLLELYRLERKLAPPEFAPEPPKPVPRLVVTPKLIFGLLTVLTIVSLLGYVVWQVRSFAAPPELVIETPVSQTQTTLPEVVVAGKTATGAVVSINGNPVVVSPEGVFKEKVALSLGLNLLEVEARNRLGKTAQKTLQVLMIQPEESQ